MEWNLLLGGEHPHSERLGYTWIEFGRRDETTGEDHFRTLLCGLKAVSGRGIARHWFAVTDQRVGPELGLLDATGTALSRDRLAEAIGAHGMLYDTARAYRRAVDEALFGLGERRYGALVDLLIQLRQPQLSKRPNETALSRALTEALPPMDQAVIADVAEAFRSLDEEKEELRAASEAEKAATGFLDHYRRYARVAARRRARLPRSEHARYEHLQRDLTHAHADRERAVEDRTAAEERAAELEERITRPPHRRRRCGPDRRCATLGHSNRRRPTPPVPPPNGPGPTRTSGRPRPPSAGPRTDWPPPRTGRPTPSGRWVNSGPGSRTPPRPRASPTGSCHPGFPRPNCAARPRSRPIAAAVRSNTWTGSRTAPTGRTPSAGPRSGGPTRRRRRPSTAAYGGPRPRSTPRARASPGRQGSCPPHRLPGTAGTRPPGLLDGLQEWVVTLNGPNPARSAASGAHRARVAELADRTARLTGRRAELTSRRELFEREVAALERGGQTAPQAPLTRTPGLRERLEGAPLWRLVEFQDVVPDHERAGLEAALEASGLLDAWVLPDGSAVAADGHDVLLEPNAPVFGVSLVDVLRPAVDHSDARAAAVGEPVVRRLLAAIGLVPSGGGPPEARLAGTWVSADGRFRSGALTGSWAKPAAEYVGEGARKPPGRHASRNCARNSPYCGHRRRRRTTNCVRWNCSAAPWTTN
ncbi:hypothetical protein NKH77_38975 [Streptomyces sp. M19]